MNLKKDSTLDVPKSILPDPFSLPGWRGNDIGTYVSFTRTKTERPDLDEIEAVQRLIYQGATLKP